MPLDVSDPEPRPVRQIFNVLGQSQESKICGLGSSYSHSEFKNIPGKGCERGKWTISLTFVLPFPSSFTDFSVEKHSSSSCRTYLFLIRAIIPYQSRRQSGSIRANGGSREPLETHGSAHHLLLFFFLSLIFRLFFF